MPATNKEKMHRKNESRTQLTSIDDICALYILHEYIANNIPFLLV